jgi:hypothetical protein
MADLLHVTHTSVNEYDECSLLLKAFDNQTVLHFYKHPVAHEIRSLNDVVHLFQDREMQRLNPSLLTMHAESDCTLRIRV